MTRKVLGVLMPLSMLVIGASIPAIVKPALSTLGAREGAVGFFQQNINLSGNIHPYLITQAQDLVPALLDLPTQDPSWLSSAPHPEGDCLKIGCDEPRKS